MEGHGKLSNWKWRNVKPCFQGSDLMTCRLSNLTKKSWLEYDIAVTVLLSVEKKRAKERCNMVQLAVLSATLPETNIFAPENQWLEDGMAHLQVQTVAFRQGKLSQIGNQWKSCDHGCGFVLTLDRMEPSLLNGPEPSCKRVFSSGCGS